MTQADKLIKIYQEAQRRLIDLIAYKEAKGSVVWYQETLLKQVRAELQRLNAYSETWAIEAITESYYAGVTETVTGLQRLGVSASGAQAFAALHTASVEILVANTASKLFNAASFVGRQIEDVVRRAGLDAIAVKQATGSTVKQAARMVKERLIQEGVNGIKDRRGRMISLDAYASTVARSTTREATNTATTNQMQYEGFDLVKMSSHATSCPVCAALQGRVYSISGRTPGYPRLNIAFKNDHANVHPNCVIGETRVNGSPAFSATSRHYEGKMFVVNTSLGKELTITPNHPVLTAKGWVVPRLLNVGDEIGHYLGTQSVVDGVPNDKEIPPTIENVARSFFESSQMMPVCVEISSEHFHGDGSGGEIGVIYPNRFLLGGMDSVSGEPITDNNFTRADVVHSGFLGDSALDFLGFGDNATTNGGMCGGGIVSPLFGSHSSITHSDSFVPIGSDGKTIFRENLPDGGFGDIVEIGNMLFRHSGDVLGNHQGRIDNESLRPCAAHHDALFLQNARNSLGVDLIDPGNLIDSLAGQIEFDHIIGIREIDFSGQVYNLHTQGNWYAANGIITHNCRHVIFPYIRALADDAEGDQRFSNRPFDLDERSKADIERYNKDQVEKRQLRNDRNQFDRYRLALGEDAPKTFAAFRRIKNADGQRWQELQQDYRERAK